MARNRRIVAGRWASALAAGWIAGWSALAVQAEPPPVEKKLAVKDTTPVAPRDEATPVAAAPHNADEIAALIRDLDADKFDLRQRATEQLSKGDASAIDPLIDATGKGSLEVDMRAVTILKELYQSPDTKTKLAAKAALEKLSKNENKAIAARAESVLKPQAQNAAVPQNRPGMFFPPLPGNIGGRIQINGGGGNIQVIQIQAGIGGGNVNRAIQVRENGRSIKINEDNNGIKISVTEPVNGKEETKNYEAKNAEELKKKHPEAHKLYEKHAAKMGGANIVVQAGGVPVQLPRRVLPGAPAQPNPPALPGQPAPKNDNQREADRQLNEARRQLDEAAKQLRAAAEGNAAGEQLRQALDKLEAASRALGEAQKKLQP